MINTVAISFSVYDENGVIMLSDVVSLNDFITHFRDGIKNTPFEQAQKIMRGSIRITEIQNIRDSVVEKFYLLLPDVSSAFPLSDILSTSQDVSPDDFLSEKLSYVSYDFSTNLHDWYKSIWGDK